MDAYVGLGSNLEDPPARVRAALADLDRLPQTRLLKASSLYRSAPVGPQDQADFCNAVARLDTGLAPLPLLDALQGLEADQGRKRLRPWGPRTLDLDLLLYDDRRMEHPRLQLPHPRLHERAFVLLPLTEIAPGLQLPGLGPVERLLEQVADQRIQPWPSA